MAVVYPSLRGTITSHRHVTRPGEYDRRVTADAGLAAFHRLAGPVARERLLAVCASPDWVDAVLAGRPYADRAALRATAVRTLAELDWSGVRTAVDAHPRIGQRPTGSSREAAWSRQEQSGLAGASVRAELAEANRAYEERFGHVFLIFATGRGEDEMLAAARARLGHDERTERGVVRAELARIVALRLERLLDDTDGGSAA
jgi:2-oxo-4-hydroxy-4-carboxy-5-ureidoimidazoline decarboxylase